MLTWEPTICPGCHRVLEGLGRFCADCNAYVEDLEAVAEGKPTRARPEIPDTRSEDDRKRDARPTLAALGWITWEAEQGYRPDACAKCGERYPGGHSTRVTLGFPDQVVLGHGIVAFLEWKSGTGKPTEGQRLRAADCATAGVPYAVVRTTTEAVEFLTGLRRAA